MKLHIGEDGAALFDEEGRRVATLSLYAFATPMECRRDDGRDERRLALARQFAASGALVDVAKRFLAMLEFDGAECTCEPGDVCPLCACKEALRKAGRG